MRTLSLGLGNRVFSYGFFNCLDCFVRVMKPDSEAPYLGRPGGVSAVFVFLSKLVPYKCEPKVTPRSLR